MYISLRSQFRLTEKFNLISSVLIFFLDILITKFPALKNKQYKNRIHLFHSTLKRTQTLTVTEMTKTFVWTNITIAGSMIGHS